MRTKFAAMTLLMVLLCAACASQKEASTPQSAPPAKSAQNPPPPEVFAPSNTSRGALLQRMPSSAPRGVLLRPVQPETGHGNAAKSSPQSGEPRSRGAAAWRNWEPVEVGDGIMSYLSTSWADGQLSLEISLAGPQEVLPGFMAHRSLFLISFIDRTGNAIMEFEARPRQFQQLPPSPNGKVTTVFETAIECPLQPYQRSVKWNFHFH